MGAIVLSAGCCRQHDPNPASLELRLFKGRAKRSRDPRQPSLTLPKALVPHAALATALHRLNNVPLLRVLAPWAQDQSDHAQKTPRRIHWTARVVPITNRTMLVPTFP